MSFPIFHLLAEVQIRGHFYWALKGTLSLGFNTIQYRTQSIPLRMLKRLEPGKALDVGMGQGRNAIYLAQQGWDVTGFDPAVFALQKADQRASELGVKVNIVVAGEEDFDWGEEQWDLILFSYADVNQNVERARRSLRSGGVVVVEGFHGARDDNNVFFDDNELIELFPDFRILQYEDVEDVADFGLKRLRVVRMLAQKP